MNNQYIAREVSGHAAVLRLTRTKAMNALNREMAEQLVREAKLAQREGAAVLIIVGEGNFAAGADVADMAELSPEEARQFLFSDLYRELETLSIPTIAAIRGYALGGGLELALTCDFRVASENAVMGLPEINLGIMPGAGGTVRLPKLVGETKAKEMIYLGKGLSAREALDCGLVSKVLPEEELMEGALGLAGKLAAKSSTALAAAKESIAFGSAENDREKALRKESDIWSALFATEDQKEGMRAFTEKRKPAFAGKE